MRRTWSVQLLVAIVTVGIGGAIPMPAAASGREWNVREFAGKGTALPQGSGRPVPAPGNAVERWRPLIDLASQRFAIPPGWIEQVIQAESRGRVERDGRPIRSVKGAMGLMQLMPGTWAEMRAALGLGSDPDHPHDNIMAGAYYLRLMYDRYGYPGLFAAYNAGPARYEKYLKGTPLPAETRAYLIAVTAGQGGSLAMQGPTLTGTAAHPVSSPLFAERPSIWAGHDAAADKGGSGTGPAAGHAPMMSDSVSASAFWPNGRPNGGLNGGHGGGNAAASGIDPLFVVRKGGGPDDAP